MKMVRCLGVGKEHVFASPNPAYNRICPKCKEKIRSLSRKIVYEPIKLINAEVKIEQ